MGGTVCGRTGETVCGRTGGTVCGRDGVRAGPCAVRAGRSRVLWSSSDHGGTARGGMRYGRDGVRAGGRDGVRVGQCASGTMCMRDGGRAGRNGMLWFSGDQNGIARGGVRSGGTVCGTVRRVLEL